jgi:glycosyltransferase involved in cell wall biosynthesis
MLNDITPVLLTFNEAPNIDRTLEKLGWARDIVVVDSGSTDETLEILRGFPTVRVFHRPFDTHHQQWAFAVAETGVMSEWILRLDADYELSEALLSELAGLAPAAGVNGYRIGFDYGIYGRRLRASLYPSNTVLLRRGCFSIADNGHTEAWRVEGREASLRGRILHDDRKSVAHWVGAQARYMTRERAKLQSGGTGMRDWLRKHPPLAPIAVFIYSLFIRGQILDGRAGLFYALQRTVAEAILSLMMLEERLSPDPTEKVQDAPSRSP